MFIKDTHHWEPVTINSTFEVMAIKIFKPEVITICNIYIPPDVPYRTTDIEHIQQQLQPPYIIAGDFNSYNTIWGSKYTNNRGRMMEPILDDLAILNDGSDTYFSARTGEFSAIDLTLCTPDLAPKLTWDVQQHLFGSDHMPIKIKYITENETDNTKKQTSKRWKLNDANWDLYQNLLNTDYEEIHHNQNVNQIIDKFTKQIIQAGEEAIGYKNNYCKRKYVPWWNKECQEIIKNNHRALNKYRKNKSPENLIELKRTKAMAKRILKQSRINSWKEYVSSITKDTPTKEIWQKIRRIKGIKVANTTTTLITENKIITDPQEITNHIAKSFHSNSSTNNYNKDFQGIKRIAEQTEIKIENNNDPINYRLTYKELNNVIQELKDNKSPGPDNITAELIKHLPNNAKKHLLAIYNHIWTKNVFPEQWRKVIIIPLLKPNKNKSNPTNYRPIALSNVICKLLEKIVNKRLIWFFETRHILNNAQSGFRNGRSTIDHLVTLTNEIQTAFARKQHLIAVFFDLQKAFEKTWRRHILNTMIEQNLNGNVLHFVQNFLSDRTFRVKHDGYMSEELEQENGFPQGSVISPTLFLLAINNLTSQIGNQIRIILFADDVVIFSRGKDISTIQENLQTSINKIMNWTQERGFCFSPTKTEAIHFCKYRKNDDDPQLQIGEDEIQFVETKKFLGVYFDRRMTWKQHIEKLKADCQQKMNILKAVANQHWGAQKEILLSLYRTLIRSKIDYGAIVYGTATPSTLKKIDVIHNTCLRMAIGAHRTSPIKSILSEAGEQPLSYRRQKLNLMYVIKLIANPTNPAHDQIIRHFQGKVTYKEETILQKQIKEQLTQINLNTTEISNRAIHKIPPWIIQTPEYNENLLKYPKHDTLPKIYKNIFQEIQYKNPGCYIYTDGSIINNKTGCAVLTPQNVTKYRLPDHCSIATAELYAIQKAVGYIKENEHITNATICTDSYSTLQRLQQLYTSEEEIIKTKEIIHEIRNQRKQIQLLWIPSHTGIKENEEVDKAAKEAIDENPTNISIPLKDMQNTMKCKIKQLWESDWKNTINNKLREIKDTTETWTTQLNRKEQTIITKIRIGHSNITHNYVFERRDPPQCDICKTGVTIKHLLLSCRKYQNERRRHRIASNLKEALQDRHIQQLLGYLKDTRLINLM